LEFPGGGVSNPTPPPLYATEPPSTDHTVPVCFFFSLMLRRMLLLASVGKFRATRLSNAFLIFTFTALYSGDLKLLRPETFVHVISHVLKYPAKKKKFARRLVEV